MSKSLGNVVTIRKVAETHDLEALRLLFVERPLPQPGRLHARQGRPAARRSIPSSTTPRRGSSTSTGRSSGSTAGAGRRRRRRARSCRRPSGRCPAFQRGDGRRLQHRGRRRPPLRVVRAREQAARRSQGGAQGRAPPDAGAAARATCSACGETLGIFQRAPAAFLPARRDRQCARQGHRRGRRRGADRGARRPRAPPRTSRAPTRSARRSRDAGHRADGHARPAPPGAWSEGLRRRDLPGSTSGASALSALSTCAGARWRWASTRGRSACRRGRC